MRALVDISNQDIKRAYDLAMSGLAPFEIKEKMNISQNEWEYINRSAYYHSLLFRPNNQEQIEDNLDYIKGIELSLFNALDQRSKYKQGSEKYAKFTTQINELQSVYTSFNIYQ